MQIGMEETTITDIDISDFSSFIFKTNNVFIEEDNPSEKVVYSWKEMHGIDVDTIRNFRGFT